MTPLPPSHSTTQAALTAARERGDQPAEAAALLALGHLAVDEKEYALAQGLYGQALALYQTLGDERGTAETLVASGVLLEVGDVSERRTAVHYWQQALVLYRTLGDGIAQAQIYVKLGYLLWNLGENEARIPLYQDALALLKTLTDTESQSHLAHDLANSMYGHPDFFAPLYEQAMQIHHEAEYRQGTQPDR